MRLALFSLASIALSFAGPALADNVGKFNLVNSGCDIKGLTSILGYSANIYSYPFTESFYTDSSYYQSEYMGNAAPIATVPILSNPGFRSINGSTTTAVAELYDIPNIPITNFALDLNGYFHGTYYKQTKIVV
jgi:hypothetical protein